MHYLDFMAALHERLAPRTYLEIGVAEGHTLAISRCASVGVDPEFAVTQELRAHVSLRKCTSDAYFDELEAEARIPFGDLPVDLTYIDGMHLLEYALRDFIGAERYSARSSVIAFDDVLPRNAEETARNKPDLPWTGDVFRICSVLKQHRPDLRQVLVDTEPTGTLLVAGLDPANTVLPTMLDEIVRAVVQPDPQPVPAGVLKRTGAISARKALSLGVWDLLVAAREMNVVS
jgi:hypothetical protein